MDDIDLTNLLSDWPYEAGNVNVRIVRALDGRQVIQLRVDLGILQLEVEGRPDGLRPEGFDSLLDYHIEQIGILLENEASVMESASDDSGESDEKDETEPATDSPPSAFAQSEDSPPSTADDNNDGDEQEVDDESDDDEPQFDLGLGNVLGEDDDDDGDGGDDEQGGEQDQVGSEDRPKYLMTPEECRAIREESVQYYHRYISMFALDEYDSVVRDAIHNLQLIDLCRKHADEDHDRQSMEQLRLHTMTTKFRALAASAAAQNDSKSAIAALDQGLAEIITYLESEGIYDEDIEEVGEVELLRGMRDSLIPKLPMSQRVELQGRLKAALAAENYELAAILRDEIRRL